MELILASITDIILPAAGDEVSGWMKMLVFVAVGAFWLVSSIVKARSDKAEAQRLQNRESARPQPQTDAARQRQLAARKARLEQQMRQRQAQAQAARTAQKRRSAPSYNRPVAQKRQPALRAPLESEHLPQEISYTETQTPKLKSLEPTLMPALKPTTCAIPAGRTEAVIEFEPAELIPGLGGPDELKAAILYHEILGLPLALREEWVNLSKY